MCMVEFIKRYYYEETPDGKFIVKSSSGVHFDLYIIEENARFDIELSNIWYNAKLKKHGQRLHMWETVIGIMQERGMVI